MSIFTISFWRYAGERAIKTVFQAAAASITVGVGLNEIDWVTIASVSAVAGIASIVTSIATAPNSAEAEAAAPTTPAE